MSSDSPEASGIVGHANAVVSAARLRPTLYVKLVRVPAGKRVTIYVVNEDPTPEEFESVSMKVEKIIPGKSKGLVRVGPLAPGRYDFFGDFNQDIAKGVLIAE